MTNTNLLAFVQHEDADAGYGWAFDDDERCFVIHDKLGHVVCRFDDYVDAMMTCSELNKAWKKDAALWS